MDKKHVSIIVNYVNGNLDYGLYDDSPSIDLTTKTDAITFDNDLGCSDTPAEMKRLLETLNYYLGSERVINMLLGMDDVPRALNDAGYYEEEKITRMHEGIVLKGQFSLLDDRYVQDIDDIENIKYYEMKSLLEGRSCLVQKVDIQKTFNKLGGDLLKRYRKAAREVREEKKKEKERKKKAAETKKKKQVAAAKKLLEKEGV